MLNAQRFDPVLPYLSTQRVSIPVPTLAPRGLPLTVQAAAVPPSGQFAAGTPAVLHVF